MWLGYHLVLVLLLHNVAGWREVTLAQTYVSRKEWGEKAIQNWQAGHHPPQFYKITLQSDKMSVALQKGQEGGAQFKGSRK